MWPDLAKFRQFGNTLQIFGNFLTVHFLFGKMLSLLWQISDTIRLVFFSANGQILKNNLAIWSHWSTLIKIPPSKHTLQNAQNMQLRKCIIKWNFGTIALSVEGLKERFHGRWKLKVTFWPFLCIGTLWFPFRSF